MQHSRGEATDQFLARNGWHPDRSFLILAVLLPCSVRAFQKEAVLSSAFWLTIQIFTPGLLGSEKAPHSVRTAVQCKVAVSVEQGETFQPALIFFEHYQGHTTYL